MMRASPPQAALIRSLPALTARISAWKHRGLSVGFVPTMGALHAGHAALVRAAAARDQRVVVSVFVNPLQFGPGEDFARYPRALAADRRLAAASGADIVFAPSAAALYGDDFRASVDLAGLTDLYCGRYRPGHFRGVCTVVLKLFNLVQADRAYFGEKDWQQVSLLERMVAELNVPTRIIRVPTIREKDGLAMSSRNAYLSPSERAAAPALYAALLAGRRASRLAKATPSSVVSAVRRALGRALKLQYAAVADEKSLLPARDLNGPRRLLAAAYCGRTRLIDNIAL